MSGKMIKKTVGIRDVSRVAGVSATTVSRVLNSSPIPSQETCRKVLAAVESLGYKVDPLFSSAFRQQGKGLRGQREKTKTLGFLSHPRVGLEGATNDHYYHEVLSSVSDAARHKDYLVMFDSVEDGPNSVAVPLSVARHCVDGLLVETGLAPELCSLLVRRLPTVFIDRLSETHPADSVCSDYALAITQMLRYLWGLGHRRIALFSAQAGGYESRDARVAYQAFYDAKKLAVPCPDLSVPQVIDPGNNDKVCAAYVQAICDAQPRPTAVIATSNVYLDLLAPFFRQAQINAPGDISLASLNDQGFVMGHDLPWTAYRHAMGQLGSMATQLLFERISDPTLAARRVYIQGQMVERATCGPPPA